MATRLTASNLKAGAALLAWYALGCGNFLLAGSRSPGWLAPVPPAIVDWLDSAPSWTLLPWAATVGCGLLGALLLLGGAKQAVTAFASSVGGGGLLLAWLVSGNWPPGGIAGVGIALWVVVSLGISIQALRFSSLQRRRGGLR